MEWIYAIIEFGKSDAGTGVILALWSLSEALALIPGVKANSVFQLLSGMLSKITRRPAVA